MKIIWNKNPLHTTIELDEHEKKELWYKIKIEEMSELLYSAYFHLKEGKYFNLERARSDLDANYYISDDQYSDLDKRCNELFEHYLSELHGIHAGDCTCVPCSCSKCYVESLLKIDTIKGLGKHSAYKIDSAFGKNNEKTIDEALISLENYNPVREGSWLNHSQEDFDRYVPRWKEEAVLAYNWLKQYKEEHLSGNPEKSVDTNKIIL